MAVGGEFGHEHLAVGVVRTIAQRRVEGAGVLADHAERTVQLALDADDDAATPADPGVVEQRDWLNSTLIESVPTSPATCSANAFSSAGTAASAANATSRVPSGAPPLAI